MAEYTYQRGETIVVFLEAVDASAPAFAAVQDVSAELKRAVNGRQVPDASVAAVAIFAVTDHAADEDAGDGWKFTLAASVTADLAPGAYITNAVLDFGSEVIEKTDPLVIRIAEATS